METSINVTVKIFDDPEYCTGDMEIAGFEYCPKLDDSDCSLFPESIGEFYGEDGSFKLVKCPECKEAYQKSIGKDHTGCTLDLGPNDIPQECVLDLPGHSEHDCVYSEEGMTKKDCGYWKTVNIKH